MNEFVVIGAPGAAEYLAGGQDLCFGRSFAKTSPECIACRAPAVLDGKIVLVRDLCAAKCAGLSSPWKLNPLSSQQVLERLERGATYRDIFLEVLGEAPPAQAGSAARQMIVDRMAYLKTVGVDYGAVPRTQYLLKPKED